MTPTDAAPAAVWSTAAARRVKMRALHWVRRVLLGAGALPGGRTRWENTLPGGPFRAGPLARAASRRASAPPYSTSLAHYLVSSGMPRARAFNHCLQRASARHARRLWGRISA